MNHFKRPLIVTGITLLVALVIGIGGVTWIYQSNLSNRTKTDRASFLGSTVAIASLVVILPFWLGAAARVAKERRETREKP